MKDSNKTQTANTKTLGLALAAFLLPAAASANGPTVVKKDLSGHVEVVHQMPGGTVIVGADWGKPKPAPQVVVVKESPKVVVVKEKPKVVVVEKRGHAYGHRDREVTVIRKAPRRQVTVIKNEPVRRAATIVKTEPAHEKKVVVVQKSDASGSYHYYEDADRISIQDNRDGRQRNVYVRK
jgi:hypothetical protein